MLSKIFERLLLNQTTEHMDRRHIINLTEFHFPNNKSATHAVLQLVDTSPGDLRQNKDNIAFVFDLAKAFYSISHEIFLER